MNKSNFSARLVEERKRLGLNQTDFGVRGGVSKWTQLNYEKGGTEPDTAYLSRIAESGADVLYILTGSRMAPVTGLTPGEAALLEAFRGIVSPESRDALQTIALKLAKADAGSGGDDGQP